jgi:DNA repair exonuclease SbcCD ATPase subunit
MKKVTLKSLTLTNFRGEKSRTTQFNDSVTSIVGGNGLGKSRHFDAFTWLLFGKDTEGRDNFNVRTVVDGEPLHRVECSVVGALDVSGETVILKRGVAEKWVKPRGQIEEIFKGEETETYWNDVPVNLGEYQRRVAEIVHPEVFKMITNPLFFVGMDWKLQREQLIQIAGTVTDAEIAASNPEFAALLDRISGKSFSDFKAEISARKKRLKADLLQIQPRIDQTRKLMPKTLDFAAAENEITALEKQAADIDRAIADKNEAQRLYFEGLQKKREAINDLKKAAQDVLFAEQTKAKEAFFEKSKERKELELLVRESGDAIAALQRSIERNEKVIIEIKAGIDDMRSSNNALREKWAKVNAEEYSGQLICHTCGQSLPESMIDRARDLYDKDKEEHLAAIVVTGKRLNEEIAAEEKELAAFVEGVAKDKDALTENGNELAYMVACLEGTPVEVERKVIPEEIPEYAALSRKIADAEAAIAGETHLLRSDEQIRKRNLSAQIDALKAVLKDRDLIAEYSAEIANLEVQGNALAQQIADVEREEFVMQQFSKARIDECTSRINGLFKHVTFKLFKYTIEGNELETCDALVDGVPFKVANTSGQINAGLDIINALTKHYGISAPVFIDRRESVNQLIDTDSQIINLVVSNDKELIIK